MARLLISLANGADGEIELLNNDFVEFWKMVFLRHKSRIPFRNSNRENKWVGQSYQLYQDIASRYETDELLELKQSFINRVNKAIEGLYEENIQWTRGKLDIHCTRVDLNRLHRGFTTLSFTHLWTDNIPMTSKQIWLIKERYLNMNARNCWPAQFSNVPGFEIPKNYRPSDLDDTSKVERVYAHLHEINAAVHSIENKCLYTPNKQKLHKHYCEYYDEQCVLTPNLDWDAKEADGITDSVKLDWNFDSALGTAFRSVGSAVEQGCNVWDLKNILGKDYETCYIDEDNPVNLDITNTVGTTKGGFKIDGVFKNMFNTILEPWLKSFGELTSKSNYFPIPVGKLDERFIKQHFTIKSDFFVADRLIGDRAIVGVDLIE